MADGEGRNEAENGVAGRADEEARVESGGGDLTGGAVQLGAEHQAAAPNLEHPGQRGEPGGQEGAVLADLREQLIVDRLEDGAGGGAGDGIAAERAAVVARDETLRRLVGDEERADREPVREPLRERDGVRPDPGLLPGEEGAGAPDAALDLVQDQQGAVLVGEGAGGRQELGGRRVDPTLALDGLDQDRGGLGTDESGERVGVVQNREAGLRRQRLERRALRRAAR